MTKIELVKKISKNTGINQADCLSLIDQVFNTMRDVLIDGQEIKINGFGSFGFQRYNERLIKEPQKGQEVKVPSRRFVRFTASQKLRVEIPVES